MTTDNPPADIGTIRTNLDFSLALQALRGGSLLARAGWNGKGQWVALFEPSLDDIMALPYLYIHSVRGERVPWVASQTDLLASDWEVVG